MEQFHAPLIRDEGEYAYSAQILKAGIAPYEHAFIQKPPMVVYSYLLADLLMPGCYLVAPIIGLRICRAGDSVVGFYRPPRIWKRSCVASDVAVTPMILLPGIEQFAANTEMFMLLPLMGTLAVYCYSRKNGPIVQVIGFGPGCSARQRWFYKYTALPVLGFVFLAWLVETGGNAECKKVIHCCAMLALGGMIAAAMELGFFWTHDGGATLWDCTVKI